MKERLSYDPFVLPFTFGLVYIVIFLIAVTVRTIKSLPAEDRMRLGKSFFSSKILVSIKEIFNECLIHRKIWKHNKVLGYMHISIAFGWFMMILLGHIEVKLYCPHRFNLPYYPIFFRYFMMETETTLKGALFFFLMDFFLLMTLSGVILAMYKRLNKKRFGMRNTTKLKLGDTIAMYSLWSIFILRLLAESFTSNVGGGSFLTRGFGLVFENFVSNPDHTLPIWWAYSIALGTFFVALPHSRFMHIPSEILLIIMRNAGIKICKKNTGYAQLHVYSCSRCGMCIDPCQMVSAAKMTKKATVYFIRQHRHNEPEQEGSAFTCLMCGRCVDACPVGVDSCSIKQNVRNTSIQIGSNTQYHYLKNAETTQKSVDVLYFAGCMTHLTPAIKIAMLNILKQANVNYSFMDEKGSICCGRPLALAGQTEAAERLIAANKQIIESSGAKTLVTSCPICYRAFNETYQLAGIEVLHHTQYIERLMNEGRLKTEKSNKTMVFHDACELGRFSEIYQPPRNVLNQLGTLQATPHDGDKGLCCGGSIGSTLITASQRKKITVDAVNKLTVSNPDYLVTSCPLCKKTLGNDSKTPVKDIAQVVSEMLA